MGKKKTPQQNPKNNYCTKVLPVTNVAIQMVPLCLYGMNPQTNQMRRNTLVQTPQKTTTPRTTNEMVGEKTIDPRTTHITFFVKPKT